MFTFASALRNAARSLATATVSPQLDAELLLARVTGRTRAQLRAAPERILNAEEEAELSKLVERRRRGEPIAYILGTREFWSLELQVNSDVLIPRPETELLVERALIHLPETRPAQALDLGTGSGAIALALAQERSLLQVTATDFSSAALKVAELNARRLRLPVRFILANWYSALPQCRFDLIVSNPPYIAENDPDLEPAVLASEPREALIAGPSGLEAIEQIVSGAPPFLLPDGWLLLEHGWRQAEAVRSLLVSAGFSGVASHADLAGAERVTEGHWSPSANRR